MDRAISVSNVSGIVGSVAVLVGAVSGGWVWVGSGVFVAAGCCVTVASLAVGCWGGGVAVLDGGGGSVATGEEGVGSAGGWSVAVVVKVGREDGVSWGSSGLLAGWQAASKSSPTMPARSNIIRFDRPECRRSDLIVFIAL